MIFFYKIVYLLIIFLSPINAVLSNDVKDFEEQKIIAKNINILPDDIEFFDEHGKKHFFDEFDGKTVLIVFWASWIDESPEMIVALDYLKKDFRKLKFDIIAISEDYQGIIKVKEFFNKYEIRHLKIYHDYNHKLYNYMKITNLPSFFLLSADFVNLYQFYGRVNWIDETVRNSILGFIPDNPVMPKNSFTKSLLKLSPEYKKESDKPKKNTIEKSKHLIPTNQQTKTIDNN
jgi:thiol-disulfide isomerase/thioredoxin